MKSLLAVGLVVKGGKQFIENWVKSAEKIADIWFVIDNNADEEVRNILINHPNTKQYLIQKNMERNQSKDYQKIMEMAREEDCMWVWNLDIDETIIIFDRPQMFEHLLNTRDDSIGFPLFEMRGDDNHYVMVNDCSPVLKHARLVHKCYKVLSHFKFNEKDKHGQSIPHNCKSGEMLPIPIKHYGHFTPELREEKRQQYKSLNPGKDMHELEQTWLCEDESKIVIKEIGEWLK